MDVKKISAEKNAAEDEILSDEQLDNVTGGNNTATGHGFWIPMKNETFDEFKKLSPLSQKTGSGPG